MREKKSKSRKTNKKKKENVQPPPLASGKGTVGEAGKARLEK